MFQLFLSQQLNLYIGQEISVAVDETLYRGVLSSVVGTFIRLTDSTDEYERETNSVLIPLTQVSFIRVPANQS
ncbi:hypothetical protein MTP04_06200 [Lysinibacillus sp. PLM2]|nr:hypothetical protein MTP04_06200 [Lysinibacillus sp. PLM2]